MANLFKENFGPSWWNTKDNLEAQAEKDAQFEQMYGMSKEDFIEGKRLQGVEETPAAATGEYAPPAVTPFVYNPAMNPILNPLAPKGMAPAPATYAPPAVAPQPDREMSDLIAGQIPGFTGMPQTRTGLGFVGARSTTPDITKLTAEQEALKKKYAGLQTPSKGPEISEDGSFYKSKNDWKPIPGMKMLTTGNLSMGVEEAAKAVVDGRAAISMYPGMGANSMKSQVAGRVYHLNPKFDQVESENNFKASQMYSGAINSAPAVQVRQYLESVDRSLDELTKASEALPRGQWKMYNWAKVEALAQGGNKAAARFKTVATETADQVAKILQGGGTGSDTSDAKLKQGVDLLNPSWSVEQLAEVVDVLKTLLENRAQGLTTNVMQTPSTQKKARLVGNSATGGAALAPGESRMKVRAGLPNAGRTAIIKNGKPVRWED